MNKKQLPNNQMQFPLRLGRRGLHYYIAIKIDRSSKIENERIESKAKDFIPMALVGG